MIACVPLTVEMLSNRHDIVTGSSEMSFSETRKLADEKAGLTLVDPMLLAWMDGKTGRFSPNVVCCGTRKPSWLIYAETRGAELSVNVNNLSYVFVYRSGL